MAHPKHIVVVGSANVDLVTRVARSPRPGESILGKSFATVTGGKGANQAVAAGRLGARVTFLGCVGNDGFGLLQRESLGAAGVDVTRMKIHPTDATGTAVILVADEGENCIVVTPSANYGIRPEDLYACESLFATADVVMSQLEIPLDTTAAAMDLARRHGAIALLDAGPAQALDPAMIARVDIISPNETEAEAITGVKVVDTDSARDAARRLRDLGAEHVVVKMGARGSFYFGAAGEHYQPPFTVAAVDTTAAGDAFTAALALAWDPDAVPQALRFANATGALAATVEGAQPSMPTRNAVDQFLASQITE